MIGRLLALVRRWEARIAIAREWSALGLAWTWRDLWGFRGAIAGGAVSHRNAIFKVQDGGGTERDLSSELNSIDFPEEIGTKEVSGFGSAARKFIVTLTGARISIRGFFTSTAT